MLLRGRGVKCPAQNEKAGESSDCKYVISKKQRFTMLTQGRVVMHVPFTRSLMYSKTIRFKGLHDCGF